MKTQTYHCPLKKVLHCHNHELHHGGVIDSVCLPYSVIGDLSRPVIVVLGGISSDHVVVGDQSQSGWWSNLVGSQKAIDTDQFCIVSLSYLWGDEYDSEGLLISTFDQARLVHKLLKQLSVKKLHAIVGCSYGGMVALAFCQLYSVMVDHLICLCAAHRNSIKTIALRKIQRQIVKLTKNNGKQGLALARSLAMLGYRGEQELEKRFSPTPKIMNGQAHFEVSRYLIHNGNKFAEDFVVDQFNNLSRSIDLHHVDPKTITAKTLIVAVNQDQMVPEHLMNELHDQLINSTLHRINSDYGHDAFLLETQKIADAIKPFIN